MLPIHILYDPDIQIAEEIAISSGISELLQLVPGRRAWNARPFTWMANHYLAAGQYISRAQMVVRPRRPLQLDADDLLDITIKGLQAQSTPSINILVTSYDLTAQQDGEYLEYVFGAIRGLTAVQSVARCRNLPAPEHTLVIRSMVQHQLGHILGMADDQFWDTSKQGQLWGTSEYNPYKALSRGYEVPEYNLGPHCISPGCIMRDANDLDEWAQHARESYYMDTAYCPFCIRDAQALGL